jgi:hypothetical protein
MTNPGAAPRESHPRSRGYMRIPFLDSGGGAVCLVHERDVAGLPVPYPCCLPSHLSVYPRLISTSRHHPSSLTPAAVQVQGQRSRKEKSGSIVSGSTPALGQIYRLAARCGEGQHYKSRQLCTMPRINISGTQFQPPAQIGATAPTTPRQSLPGSPM